jgi:glycosidase
LRIYEINTRLHCCSFDQITSAELKEIASLGFDAIWPMGAWQISEGALKISKVISEDYEGSPYAIPDYKFNRALGGKSKFKNLVERAHAEGLSVIVDFVSNHMALDSSWISDNPEFFIASNPQVRKQKTDEYFLHKSGVFAFGRDPFFPPWHDTAQLDYTNKKLRERMIEVLLWISRFADGVRCDMAMLVLRDYIHTQWYPDAPEGWFDQQMPHEFWKEAISQVKKSRPDFTFIAETYWDKEPILLDLGFDLVYEKKLYDALVARNAQYINERLSIGIEQLQHSLSFIENHDEPRAASVLTAKDNLAAAALILSLPSSALIHEGQMEGKRERLPVQRLKPLMDEPPDPNLKQAYSEILTATSQDVFKRGSFMLFDSQVWGTVSFLRQNDEKVVAYVGQISEGWHKFYNTPLDLTAPAHAIGASGKIQVTNLINSHAAVVEEYIGAYKIQPDQLAVVEDTQFIIIEVSVA